MGSIEVLEFRSNVLNLPNVENEVIIRLFGQVCLKKKNKDSGKDF